MFDRRGVEIVEINPEESEVILADGELITGNTCDRLLSGSHLAATCVDHYKPWL